jgi:hypothetical protein
MKEIFLRAIKLQALIVFLTGNPQAQKGIIIRSSGKN